MDISVIIPVFNKLDVTKKCLSSIQESNKDGSYEIVIVDNGSSDETEQFFSNDKRIKYIRNNENLGISKACNTGADAAAGDIFCFMHNDVFVHQENWIAAMSAFIVKTAQAGVVGLYGAKTIRKDGSFRGKSIVHAIRGKPSIRGNSEKVAVVDGLMLAMSRTVFQKSGGFCDGFTIHFYDKDMSMRVYKNGFVNYVLNIPFEHLCAATRSEVPREDTIRNEARDNFIEVWGTYLPLDVTTWREKMEYTLKRKKDK